MLPSEATHYILPVAGVVGPYLEIFESPSITGIVMLQTVASSVKESEGGRSYQRLKALVKQERKKSIYFSNESCVQTYVNASAESNWSWYKRFVTECSACRPVWCLSPSVVSVTQRGVCHPAWCLSPSMVSVTQHGVCHPAWCLSPSMVSVTQCGACHPVWCLSPSMVPVTQCGVCHIIHFVLDVF